MKTFAVFN